MKAARLSLEMSGTGEAGRRRIRRQPHEETSPLSSKSSVLGDLQAHAKALPGSSGQGLDSLSLSRRIRRRANRKAQRQLSQWLAYERRDRATACSFAAHSTLDRSAPHAGEGVNSKLASHDERRGHLRDMIFLV